MADIPDVDDLRLVAAISASGSVGSAARLLQVSQPSASQRLARLERRVGVRLFDRDTQGARPTPAGAELARQARHILGHLERAYDAARAAGESRRLRVGAFYSLAESLFPVLGELLGSEVDEVADHGPVLLEWLAEGTLDAAVVGIAGQVEVPTGLRVQRIGRDELVLVVPAGVRLASSGRQPLRDATVVFASYDAAHEAIRRGLAGLGARPHRAATVPTALASARRRGCPAVVPRSATMGRQPGETVRELPLRHRPTLSLVVPRQADDRLTGLAGALRERFGLRA